MKNKLFLLALVGTLFSGSSLFAKHHDKKSMSVTPDELKWIPNPAKPEEISVAVVWGDMNKGKHGAYHKFKAGTKAENHSHSSTLYGVVVKGTMVMGPEDSPKTLPPGSYFKDMANENHITQCEGSEDCIIYIHTSGKFDVKWAKKKEEK